ncbi:MAG: lipopolysaccharide biosynthesis protein [Deltaproteobacteria bacterium]|nr:lipopolysaccharide biosynthesis protein [Deltaproteobacteria bacterium]
MSSLRKKLIKGTIWNSISQFGTVGCNFVLTIILARLLNPEDYGLLGMVMVITGFLGYFSEFGMISSIIRKKNVDNMDTCTAFWSGVVFSLLIYVILFLVSPLIAIFYHRPELTSISRCVSLVFFLGAYGFIPSALQIKELKYGTISLISLCSIVLSGIAAVVVAFWGFGVWALVAQLLIQRFLGSLGCFLFISWKPQWIFSWERFCALFSFGFHITINNLFKFLSENVDRLLIGRLLGSTLLGYYTMAFRLSRFPTEKLWAVFGKMLFPAFAAMQGNFGRMKKNYFRVSLYGGLMFLPIVLILIFAAEPLIRWTVGEKWLPACNLIRIFSVYILILSVSFGDEPVMLLLDVKILNLLKVIQSILLFVLGYYAIRQYGVYGMAWTYVSCYLLFTSGLKVFIYKCLIKAKAKYPDGI